MNIYHVKQNELAAVLNHIYTGSNNTGDMTLRNDTKKTIKNGLKKEKQKIFQIISYNESHSLKQWMNVYQKVKNDYHVYLQELKKNNNKIIEILIISEAPMLSLDDKGNFRCNYIFSDCVVGGYRNVPYEAISIIREQNKHPNYKTLAAPIIDLFNQNRVGFVDLIPLPLPQISSELRSAWSENKTNKFMVKGRPHIIQMLDNSIEHFIHNTQIAFSKDLKIVLMMPPNTAKGILNYCAGPMLQEKSNSFLSKYGKLIVQKQLVNSASGYPSVNLFINAIQ